MTLNNLDLSGGNELQASRIKDLLQSARGLSFPTQVELQAEIYSRLNAILELDDKVSILTAVRGETPALSGDVYQNLQLLSKDALGISQQLLALEQDAAQLFNLAAAAQNALRQQVRGQVFTSTFQDYEENFIDGTALDSINTSASLDFGVGTACLPLLSEQPAIPSSLTLGVNCDAGSLTGDLSNLLDQDPTTFVTWNGSLLELFFTFKTPTIINRITITLDRYQGITLNTLLSSPDGILVEDLRQDLAADALSLDGSSNKFSGDVTLDFDPRHVKYLRLVLQDLAGAKQISLRDVSFVNRTYDTSGTLQTVPLVFDKLGTVSFEADVHTTNLLTAVTHQISYDGLSFQTIQPGQEIDLGATKCWYRALLQRMDANFAQAAAPIDDPGTDPAASTGWFQIKSVNTLDLGNNVLQRTININILAQDPPSSDTRLVVLQETPLPNTLTVYQGSTLLGPDVYRFANNAIAFATPEDTPGIIICYQTSAVANAGIVARKNSYTPRISQINFRRTF